MGYYFWREENAGRPPRKEVACIQGKAFCLLSGSSFNFDEGQRIYLLYKLADYYEVDPGR